MKGNKKNALVRLDYLTLGNSGFRGNFLGNQCVGLGLNLRSKVAFPACFWQSLLPDWHDQRQTRSCIEIQTEFIRSSALRAKY